MGAFPVTRTASSATDRRAPRPRPRDAARSRRLRLPALRLSGRGRRGSARGPAGDRAALDRPSLRRGRGGRRARDRCRAPVRHPGDEGRGRDRGLRRRRNRPARRCELLKRARPASCSSPTSASASTRHTATAASFATARSTTTSSLELLARTAIEPRRGRRRRGRSERHDGRARRRDPRGARRGGLRARADRRLLGEVRIGVLRPVPRGRRFGARVRRSARATRWIRRTSARRCASARSTSTEGADAIMVKPALPYLDVIARGPRRASTCPSPPTTSAASTRW